MLRDRRILFPIGVVIVGLNLRPLLASTGPLLDIIQLETGLSDSLASLLTALPVFIMGICMFGSAWIRKYLGERWGVLAGITLVLFACVARGWWPSVSPLLMSAMIGGIGIAIVQALMPIVIRAHSGAKTASLMGLYSTAIMGGALIASMAAPWIARGWNWPMALGIWAIPALIGVGMWWLIGARVPTERSAVAKSAYGHQRAWSLMAFFGLGTGAYALVLAWLPPFFMELGWSPETAGALLGLLTGAEVVAGLAVSAWASRAHDRRPALYAAIAALLAGMLALCFAPQVLAWPACVLAGLGIGALFPLSLIVAMDHGDTGEMAGRIVSFVQGGGYTIAAVLPLVAGIIRQNLEDLTMAWWLMSGLCLVMALLAVRFRPGDRIRAT